MPEKDKFEEAAIKILSRARTIKAAPLLGTVGKKEIKRVVKLVMREREYIDSLHDKMDSLFESKKDEN